MDFEGDLVHSMGGSKDLSNRLVGSVQHEEEWRIYRNILDRTNVTKTTKWLDIRGNHGENNKDLSLYSNISLVIINRYIYGSTSRLTEKFLSVRTFSSMIISPMEVLLKDLFLSRN